MPREDVNPASLNEASGFSHITIARGSRLVFFAGIVALDKEWNVIGEGNLAEQTKAAMRNLELAMKEVGVGWNDIVRRTIYTLEPTDWKVIADAIDEVTQGAPHPAQSVVGVSSLALPELLIEVECTASID